MTTNPPKRCWLQFRLRTLLIAILVLSVPLSWFAVRMEKARRQREAVEAIERLGGSAAYDYRVLDGPFLPLPPPPRFAALRRVLGDDFFSSVVSVNWTGEDVDDSDLRHLKTLTHLKRLYLDDTSVSDAGLLLLKELSTLEYVSLKSTKVTEAGINELKAALPGVQTVDSIEFDRLWKLVEEVTHEGNGEKDSTSSLRLVYPSKEKKPYESEGADLYIDP